MFPAQCSANERATIEGRIEVPQAKARARERITPALRKHAVEFVKLLVPAPGKGQPMSCSDVEEMQQKPLQRSRNDANRMLSAFSMLSKSFQKKEAYNNPNWPRNISTVPHGQNQQLSGFTYAFKKDCLQQCDWYAPCLTPVEIATRVTQLASESEELVESDFHKFDGSFKMFIRKYVEHAAYRRWVGPEHRSELDRLLDNELSPRAVTKSGIKYETYYTRLSGSPLTTDGNSECNAFVSFAANRLSGQDLMLSWKNIGLIYGDDGLRNGTVTTQRYLDTASALGLDLDVINRATPGNPVSFLSRIYADPWSSPATIQSPLRTLLKLNSTCDTQNDIDTVGWYKTGSYLDMDAYSPLIGEWCRCYRRISVAKTCDEALLTDNPYWAQFKENNSWPQSDDDVWIGIVADELNISGAELEAHIVLLKDFNGKVEDMPRLHVTVDQTPKFAVALDGEVHAGPIEDSKDSNTESKKPSPKSKTKHGDQSPNDQALSNGTSSSLIDTRPTGARKDSPKPSTSERNTNTRSERRRNAKQTKQISGPNSQHARKDSAPSLTATNDGASVGVRRRLRPRNTKSPIPPVPAFRGRDGRTVTVDPGRNKTRTTSLGRDVDLY